MSPTEIKRAHSMSSCKVPDAELKQKKAHFFMAFFRQMLYSLAKQIVMTCKSLCSFSICVKSRRKTFYEIRRN